MDTVKARSGDKATQPALEVDRKSYVRVVEQNRYQKTRLPDGRGYQGSACHSDLSHPPRYGKQHLTKVKTNRSRRVEIEIDVMHKMKTPEERNLMCEYVPYIEAVIE